MKTHISIIAVTWNFLSPIVQVYMGQSLCVKKRGNMYYLRKSFEIPFIGIRRVRERMKVVGKKLTVAQIGINTIEL
jgi:hypothetical protein